MLSALAGAATALVGGALGLRGSAWLQEREHARRQRNTSVALREDLRRISAALGAEGFASVASLERGSEPEVPGVHRWVEGLIVDLASADPAVLRGFMTLEQDLAGRAQGLEVYLQAARADADTRSLRANYEQWASQRDSHEQLYREELAKATAAIPERSAALRAQEARFDEGDHSLRANLDQLCVLLDALIAKPIPQFVPGDAFADDESLHRRLR